jgi:hypothetical protein
MKAAIVPLAALLCAAPAIAVTGGKLGTLERGNWTCELPGDAAVGRGVPVPEANFVITPSSTYRTEQGAGKYLRTGDTVIMTSGPRKGERYNVQNERMLRKLAEDGSDGGLRCVRLGAAAS